MNTTSSQLVYDLNWGSDPFSIEWGWWDGSPGGFALNLDLKNIVYTATSSIANLNAATSSYLYSGSYNSAASVITLYSANQNYTLDLSGLAGGGGGFPITASDEGVDLTNSMTKINFVGNAVSASNVGSIVTVTINTGSAAGTTDITALNNFTGSAQTNLNALNLATSSYVTNNQTSSFLSNIYNSDGEVTGNREVLAIDKTLLFQMSGSSQFLVSDGSIVGAGQTWTFQVDNQGVYLDGLLSNTPTDYVVAYDSVSTQLSYFSTSSLKTDITALNTFTGSANSRLDSLQAATSSYLLINTPVTASAFSSSYYDFTPMADGAVPYKNGRLYYHSEDGALTFYNEETDISLQIGQEFYLRVFNGSGGVINDGTPVRISGSQGDRPVVYPAIAEDHAGVEYRRENHLMGLATHTIGINEEGYVTRQGIVKGIDTSAFAAGDVLYLQTGSAGLRNSPPGHPYDTVRVGWVTKVASPNGFVFVEPKSPTHLVDISEVSSSLYSAEVGDLLVKNSNNSLYYTKTLSGSYKINNGGLTAVSFTGSLKGNVDGNAKTATSASYAPNLYNTSGILEGDRRVDLSNYNLTFNNSGARFIVSGSDRVYFKNLNAGNFGYVVTYDLVGDSGEQGIINYVATSSLSVATASYAPNLYNSNGTLTGGRVVTFGDNDLRFNPGAGEFRVSDGPVGGPFGYEIVMSGSGEFRINSSVSASLQTNVYVSPSHVLTLAPRHPLPTVGIPLGSFAVSSSTPPRPYMWDGSSWYAL